MVLITCFGTSSSDRIRPFVTLHCTVTQAYYLWWQDSKSEMRIPQKSFEAARGIHLGPKLICETKSQEEQSHKGWKKPTLSQQGMDCGLLSPGIPCGSLLFWWTCSFYFNTKHFGIKVKCDTITCHRSKSERSCVCYIFTCRVFKLLSCSFTHTF